MTIAGRSFTHRRPLTPSAEEVTFTEYTFSAEFQGATEGRRADRPKLCGAYSGFPHIRWLVQGGVCSKFEHGGHATHCYQEILLAALFFINYLVDAAGQDTRIGGNLESWHYMLYFKEVGVGSRAVSRRPGTWWTRGPKRECNVRRLVLRRQ